MSEGRFKERVDKAGNHYIDMTPTWLEILPAWQMIVGDATTTQKPDQMERFWQQMETMALAADKWNAYCAEMNDEADMEEQARVNEGLRPPEGKDA